MTNISPDDVQFAGLADEYVAAMLSGDKERGARALTAWIAEVIRRTSELSLQAARILADDAARRALAPLLEEQQKQAERLLVLEREAGE